MVFQQIIGRLKKASSLNTNNRSPKRQKRRLIQLERMEKRELLANDLAAVSGVTFDDLNGDGTRDVGEPVIPNVSVSIFRESNVNGVYDGPGSATEDVSAGTAISDANGLFRFPNLDGPDNDNPGGPLVNTRNPDGVGRYWLVQSDVAGRIAPDPVGVDITDDSGVQQVVIDDYSDNAGGQAILDFNLATFQVSSGGGLNGVVGGERDIELEIVSNTDQSNTGLVSFGVGIDGVLRLATSDSAVAIAKVQYDGVDADGTGLALNPTGLSENLNSGDVSAGIELDISSDQAIAGGLKVFVYTDATNFSTASIDLDGTGTFDNLFIPFADFTLGVGAAGPADFSTVGAIEAILDPTVVDPDVTSLDTSVRVIESRISNENTVNLANVIPLSLGGSLFIDNSPGGQNNGIRESNEVAVSNGVLVELYELQDADDTIDLSANPTPIDSQTTFGAGDYLFTELTPGHYAVVINVAQLDGPILGGFANSTGNDPAPDPDDDVDDDDNGIALTSINPLIDGAVFTQTITLVSQVPINGTDPNTNTTVDFGFFPQIDLGINKTFDVANSNANAGGNATFDFTVQNNGPRDATGVVVTDIFPSGLTPTGIQNESGNFTLTAFGNAVTVDIGDIPSGTSVTFELTADISANQFTDLTNPASVAGNEVDTDSANDSDIADVDLPQADLSIIKTDLQDPINAGEQLTYEITVTNNGPDAAAGVQVVDSLPDEVTFVSGDVGGNQNLVNVEQGTGNIIADIGPLADQASAVVTIIVLVSENAPTPLSNDATVTSTPNTDPNPDNNSTSEDTTINRLVDVEIDKTVNGSVIAGENATYTVVVTNNGPSEARGIEVTDTLDGDLTLVSNSFDPGASGVILVPPVGQDLTFTVGSLAAAATATFTFDVTIGSDATGTIPNTANVTTTDTDSDSSNNADSADFAVDQEIDLVLTKTVDSVTAVPGQDQLVYTFTVEHDVVSPSDATGVIVSDTLPAGVSGVVIDAATADQTDFSNGVVSVTFDSLPVGQTRTFTVTVDVDEDATGTIVNPASVTGNETETDVTDNSDDATTTLNPDFDVEVTKAVNDAAPDPGQTITYTVGLENEGPSTAFGVVLSDSIPAGLTFESAILGGQNGTSDGSTVTFPGIDLASGETANATLTFIVDATATGIITNTAGVPNMSAAGENDVTNNDDSVDLIVAERVDLRIAKTVSAADSQVGNTLIYTVTVNNNGPSLAEAVSVVDTLPSGMTFVSGTGPNNEALAIDNGVITVDGGDLANAGSFSFTIEATVDAGAASILTNTATVTTTTNETTLGNNTATVSTNIDPMTASIGGSVYVDTNNNGSRDANEDGILGVAINLSGFDALGNAVSLNASTDSNGDYLFANLGAGTYTVEEIQPDGFIDGIDTQGTGAGAIAGDDIFTELGLVQAATAADFDFGERIFTDAFSKRRFLASS